MAFFITGNEFWSQKRCSIFQLNSSTVLFPFRHVFKMCKTCPTVYIYKKWISEIRNYLPQSSPKTLKYLMWNKCLWQDLCPGHSVVLNDNQGTAKEVPIDAFCTNLYQYIQASNVLYIKSNVRNIDKCITSLMRCKIRKTKLNLLNKSLHFPSKLKKYSQHQKIS